MSTEIHNSYVHPLAEVLFLRHLDRNSIGFLIYRFERLNVLTICPKYPTISLDRQPIFSETVRGDKKTKSLIFVKEFLFL